jgi:hypothetical protein
VAGPSRARKGVDCREHSRDDGVHGALELTRSISQHITTQPRNREATISESHEALAANTAPPRRKRRRSAPAGRSDKADLGFPLAQRGGAARPKTTLPRSKWHPRVSPWSASAPPSWVFTRVEDHTLAKQRQNKDRRQGCHRGKSKASFSWLFTPNIY